MSLCRFRFDALDEGEYPVGGGELRRAAPAEIEDEVGIAHRLAAELAGLEPGGVEEALNPGEELFADRSHGRGSKPDRTILRQ